MDTAARLPARSRSSQVQPLINSIASFAHSHGLGTVPLSTLFELVRRPSYLDQTSIATVIKALYPAGLVPSALVCNVVASLGVGGSKPSPQTQNLLLRWILLVYEVLEDTACISKLYTTLFNLLDTMSIRYYRSSADFLPLIMQIISMPFTGHDYKKVSCATIPHSDIVRRYLCCEKLNLTSFQRLELYRTTGNGSPLLGLLRVYEDYCPDIMIGQSTPGRLSKFEVRSKPLC